MNYLLILHNNTEGNPKDVVTLISIIISHFVNSDTTDILPKIKELGFRPQQSEGREIIHDTALC